MYGFVIVVAMYNWWDVLYAKICTLLNICQLIFPSVIFKAVNLLIGVKKYSSNKSYLLNILYLLHLDLYLNSIYPWIRITRVQNYEVFCIINIICKWIRIALFSLLLTYSIIIHDGCHIWTRGHWPLRITWLRTLFFFVQVCEDQ